MSALSFLTDIGSVVLNAVGISKQADADALARKDMFRLEGQKYGLESRKLASQIAMQNRELGLKQRQHAREWRFREDEAEYKKAMGFVDRFNKVLDKTPALRNNLAQLWQGRG